MSKQMAVSLEAHLVFLEEQLAGEQSNSDKEPASEQWQEMKAHQLNGAPQKPEKQNLREWKEMAVKRVDVETQTEPIQAEPEKEENRLSKESSLEDDNKIAERKLSKEKQREAIAHRCVETPLQEVSMLGHCLLYHNKLIHICTNCGNTCLINNQSFKYDVNLNCSMCIQTMKKPCEKCSNVVQCNEILALDTKKTMFRIAHICQSCTSVYAQVQPIKI